MNVIIDDTGASSVSLVERGSRTPWAPRGSLCWYCCHSYGDHPIPMPVEYDEKKKVYTVSGCFCSFACMTKYSQESITRYSATGKKGMAIFQFWKDVTKSSSPAIPRAPPKQFLDVFGGHMTIEEFRKSSDTERYVEIPDTCILKDHVFLKKSAHAIKTRHMYKAKIHAKPGESSTLKMKHNSIVPKEPERKQSGPTLLEKTLGLCPALF